MLISIRDSWFFLRDIFNNVLEKNKDVREKISKVLEKSVVMFFGVRMLVAGNEAVVFPYLYIVASGSGGVLSRCLGEELGAFTVKKLNFVV